MSKYYQFKFIDEPLVIAYRQPDSISANQGAVLKALKQILETHFENIKQDKAILAGYYFWLGTLLCSCGKFSQGRGYFVRSVKAYPLDIRVLVLYWHRCSGKAYTIW